jgi:hypothetical protein
MLDLMTLAVSCGLQNELENVRKERGGKMMIVYKRRMKIKRLKSRICYCILVAKDYNTKRLIIFWIPNYIRKFHLYSPGEAFEQEATTPNSSMAEAADTVSSGVTAVENCVSQAVSSMIPSYQMVQNVRK